MGWEAGVNSGDRPQAAIPAGVELRISEFSRAEEFYFNYPDNPRFDVLLLDIHMGDMDGFELAKRIRQKDRRIAVVFITGDPDYAGKGYDVDAAGYFIKPVRREELYAVMDKCIVSLKRGKTELLWETDGELCKIYQEDIPHFESAGHMITAVTADASFESRMSWADLESLISHDMFARTHRSYIIGLGHVDVLGKTEVTLDSGTVLPVSRRLEKELREKFVGFHVGCDAVWFP
ncbi:MAG TPA: LytTR family DNA-binding domain-containing protein [Bacillota bacterium]|nr:LytTR family DNA-binding domain-containing protein [Bacillota bacterium]HQD81406.1 LytTR family DNA-binding domain-containing protein [Bacillota bacterium]